MANYRRNIAVPGDDDFFMTGPACVDNCINQCALTAKGTQGYTGFGEEGQTSSPCSPAPLPSPPSPVPVPNPPSPSPVTCVPIGNCDMYSWCTQAEYVEWCNSQSACPSPFCKTASSAPTPSPTTTPAPTPMPTSTTTSIPRRCVPTLEGFYTDPAVYGPICAAQEQGNVCVAPMCKWEASLAQQSARSHRFLGLALLQAKADVDSNILLENGNEEL